MNSQTTAMAPIQFQVVHTRKQLAKPEEHVIVLEPTSWDDYGIKCSFVVLVPRGKDLLELGTWKIIDSDKPAAPRTEMPARFTELPPRYVSLGQQIAAYQRVTGLPAQSARAILRGLRDVVFRPVPGLEAVEWFGRSLARFAAARAALKQGSRLLDEAGLLPHQIAATASSHETLSLAIRAQLRGFPTEHVLSFEFPRNGFRALIRRVVVLVGPNGSGKTQLLAALARSLSGLDSRDITVDPDKPFAQVVAVSYGAFDHFLLPRFSNAPISYVYCGLRVPVDSGSDENRIVLDIDRAIAQGVANMTKLYGSDRHDIWHEALDIVGLSSLVAAVAKGTTATERHMREQLSAGQKLVALTISNLAVHLLPGSIVLHDEPETHLHPNLLSALLRAMHVLLQHFESYAIVATHSIIPAQETPSANIIILDRYDDGSVRAFPPPEQCFAATLDEITRIVFRAGPKDQNFRRLLEALRGTYTLAQIRELLGGEISLGTRLFLAEDES